MKSLEITGVDKHAMKFINPSKLDIRLGHQFLNPSSVTIQTVAYINTLNAHGLISPTCHFSSFRANQSSEENAEGGPAEPSDIVTYCVTGC